MNARQPPRHHEQPPTDPSQSAEEEAEDVVEVDPEEDPTPVCCGQLTKRQRTLLVLSLELVSTVKSTYEKVTCHHTVEPSATS